MMEDIRKFAKAAILTLPLASCGNEATPEQVKLAANAEVVRTDIVAIKRAYGEALSCPGSVEMVHADTLADRLENATFDAGLDKLREAAKKLLVDLENIEKSRKSGQ